MDKDKCAIRSFLLKCKDKDMNTLGSKGTERINKASIVHDLNIRVEAGQQIQAKCWKGHSRPPSSSKPKGTCGQKYTVLNI
jgi:hypothetical protein